MTCRGVKGGILTSAYMSRSILFAILFFISELWFAQTTDERSRVHLWLAYLYCTMRSYLRWFCIVQHMIIHCIMAGTGQSVQRLATFMKVREWNTSGVEIFRRLMPRTPLYSKLGYKVSCLGIKRPGRVVDQSSSHSAEVKERVEVYLYSPSGHLWPVVLWTATMNWKYCSINYARINSFFLFVGSIYWWCSCKG